MPCQAVFFFKQGGQGWEERWFSDDAFTDHEPKVRQLAIYRAKLMGIGCTLHRYAVRDTEPPSRLAVADVLDYSGYTPASPSTSDNAIPYDVAILIRVETADGRHNQAFMRGCPAGKFNAVLEQAAAYEPWDTNFITFKNYLINNFKARVQQLPPFVGAIGGTIRAIVGGGLLTDIKVSFDVAQNLNDGFKIKIIGGKGLFLPKGIFRIYNPTPANGTDFYLSGTANQAAPYGEPTGYARSSASWRTVAKGYVQIKAVETAGVTDRDVGRPFGQQVGRRKGPVSYWRETHVG
jgi:hypothetical protein